MCLVLLAYRRHASIPLVVAANRDEFYERPTAPAQFWDDQPHLLAGRDLEAGGTWLGVTRSGRFAAVTNFAEASPVDAPRSRGELTQRFLSGTQTPAAYARTIDLHAYRGFNLLLYADGELHYVSNRADHAGPVEPGIWGLANARFGARWPKVMLGSEMLASAMPEVSGPQAETHLLGLLADRRVPPDDQLPHSDRPLEVRRSTASCFIAGDEYGTRASTCVLLGTDEVRFVEKRFRAGGVAEQGLGSHGGRRAGVGFPASAHRVATGGSSRRAFSRYPRTVARPTRATVHRRHSAERPGELRAGLRRRPSLLVAASGQVWRIACRCSARG